MYKNESTPDKTHSTADNKYIYHFIFNNNFHYIGKYSNKDFYQYHLRRAAPLFLNFPSAVPEDSIA
jgi:hypothetical protein